MSEHQQPKQQILQWSTRAGYVILTWPSDLTEEDVADVRAVLAITLGGMERRAREPITETTMQADAEIAAKDRDA